MTVPAASAAAAPSRSGAALARGGLVLAVLLGAAELAGVAAPRGVQVVTLAVVQAVFLLAWFPALAAPAPGYGLAVSALCAVVVDVLLGLGADGGSASPLVWVLGPVFTVAIVVQLLRRDGREGVVASLMATMSGALLACAGALLLVARAAHDGRGVVVAALVAAVLASAVTIAFAAYSVLPPAGGAVERPLLGGRAPLPATALGALILGALILGALILGALAGAGVGLLADAGTLLCAAVGAASASVGVLAGRLPWAAPSTAAPAAPAREPGPATSAPVTAPASGPSALRHAHRHRHAVERVAAAVALPLLTAGPVAFLLDDLAGR